MEEKVNKKKQLTHRIDFRVSAEVHGKLQAFITRARGIKTVSQLLRKILEEGKFTIETYDVSRDKILEELSGIRRELRAIGVNVNQVTRRFHSESTTEGRLFQALEIAKLFQQADLRLTEMIRVIAKIAEG